MAAKAGSVWRGVHLATFAGTTPYGIIDDGALWLRDGRIIWLGPRAALPPLPAGVTVYDGHGGWLTPGLIDCHTHLIWAGSRAGEFERRLQGASYADIAAQGGGILATVRATRAATEDELLHAAVPRLRALLAEGVTTVEIKSGYGLDVANEVKMLRVARRLGTQFPVTVQSTLLAAHALPPDYAGRAEAYIDEEVCGRMIPQVAAQQLAVAVDVFCEHLAFTPAQTERVFQAAQAHGLAVKLHAEQLSHQGGSRLAARYRALSVDHGEYLREADVAALAEAGTVLVLLPGAFYSLRETQQPPLAWLRRDGVALAVATDLNPGTAPLASLLLMLNMACTLFRLTPEESLRGVTVNAARALGLADRGELAVGKVADLALWDIGHPAELAACYLPGRCRGVIKHGVWHAYATPIRTDGPAGDWLG